MKVRVIISIIFLNLLLAKSAFCKINIHFPPNNVMFETDTITVSGYSDEKISDELIITAEGDEEYSGKSRVEKFKLNKENIFYVKLHLFPGINKISIGEEVRNIFFNDKSVEVPYAFSMVSQHPLSECDSCHITSPIFSKKIISEVNKTCGECHDQVKGRKNIHPGFEDNTCIDCHNPHFSKAKKLLVKEMKTLCLDCHDSVTEIKGAEFTIVHPPVAEGECSRCHDAHASDNDFLLLKKKYDLCTTCHPEPKDSGHGDEYDDCSMCHEHHRATRFLLLKDNYWDKCLECHDEVADQKFKHLPKGRGCGDCHDPHSDTDLVDVKKSCKNCHKNEDPEYKRFHGGLKLPVEKCLKCHTPHNAYNQRLLKSKLHFPLTQAGNCITCHKMDDAGKNKIGWVVEKSEVCFKCHGDKKPLIGYDKSVHPPVLNGDCIQCHSPHLKLERAHLVLPLKELCYKCHENYNETAKKNSSASVHLPVEENDCLVCHDAHKSEQKALLETKLNDLCFDCHYEKTSNFGGKEMIYYHEPPTNDLCTDCHEPHISSKKYLVRDKK